VTTEKYLSWALWGLLGLVVVVIGASMLPSAAPKGSPSVAAIPAPASSVPALDTQMAAPSDTSVADAPMAEPSTPPDKFSYTPADIGHKRMLEATDTQMAECIQMMAPGLMNMQSRTKIRDRLMRQCVLPNVGLNGLSRDEIVGFGAPTIDNEIELMIANP